MAKDTTVPPPKKRTDAYTGFLAISFLAMVGGCVLLYLDYEQYKDKKLPDPIKLDVPGVQLKNVPGTGGPPPPKPKVEEPMEPPKEMMRLPAKPDTLPVILPAVETVDAVRPEPVIEIPTIQQVQAVVPVTDDRPVIRIPELPPPPAAVESPVTVVEPIRLPALPTVKPMTPSVEPSVSDEPPVQPKRFVPEM